MPNELIQRANVIADEVLFPAAAATDAADIVPRSNLDLLAREGFYGIASHETAVVHGVMEALAGGCLSTAFVWLQHVGPTRMAAAHPLGEELRAGALRSGSAFAHLRRSGPPSLVATRHANGWVLNGTAPWVTGWQRIDVLHVAAMRADDPSQLVWMLVDAVESESLIAQRLDLAAVNASSTVSLQFRSVRVPLERVTVEEPLETWTRRDSAGLRTNGSVAIGHASRTIRLLGNDAGSLERQLDLRRRGLDSAADVEAVTVARAAAVELAVRAATALVARGGGTSITSGQTAQRLAREATFIVVQGQTLEVRAAQMALFTGRSADEAPSAVA